MIHVNKQDMFLFINSNILDFEVVLSNMCIDTTISKRGSKKGIQKGIQKGIHPEGDPKENPKEDPKRY